MAKSKDPSAYMASHPKARQDSTYLYLPPYPSRYEMNSTMVHRGKVTQK